MRAILFLVLLAGCASASPGLPICTPSAKWSPAEQDALALELDTRDGPLSHQVVHEWEQLRAASRPCLQGTP